MAFCLWWLYFDHASSVPAQVAREARKLWIYQIWLYSHLPLMIGLSGLGVSIQLMVLTSQQHPLPPLVKWLLCSALAISFLSIGLIHVTSCYAGTRLVSKIGLLYLGTASVIMTLAGVTPVGLWPVMWSLMLGCICIFNVVINVFFDREIQNAGGLINQPE